MVPVSCQSVFSQMHTAFRKVFQLPALPKHQPKLQSWQRPPTPTLSVRYPPAPAQASPPLAHHLHQHNQQVHTQQLAEDRGPTESREAMAIAAETEAPDGAAADTLEAQEETEARAVTSAQEASLQRHPAAPTEERKEAAIAAAAAEAADPGTGLVEEPSYRSARGLKPSPAARALAGPTMHILLEGYVGCSASHRQQDPMLNCMCRADVLFLLEELVRMSRVVSHPLSGCAWMCDGGVGGPGAG